MDYLPYAFFCQTKTSVLAVTHASENPVDTIRLNAYDGSKMLKKVISSKKCRDCILFALNFFKIVLVQIFTATGRNLKTIKRRFLHVGSLLASLKKV